MSDFKTRLVEEQAQLEEKLDKNNSPSKEQISELRNDIKKHISEQLESGLTCMMCRKPKQNDGHTCCEECAGLAF